jgi:hypothetical protein
VFGDSVNWGQGLRTPHKFSHAGQRRPWRGTQGLSRFGCMRTPAPPSVFEVPTRPGRSDGEVPVSYPTLLEQVASCDDRPEDVAVIILNGGIKRHRYQSHSESASPRRRISATTIRQFCYQRHAGAPDRGDPGSFLSPSRSSSPATIRFSANRVVRCEFPFCFKPTEWVCRFSSTRRVVFRKTRGLVHAVLVGVQRGAPGRGPRLQCRRGGSR